MEYPQYVKVVLDKLTAAGFDAYIVGGSLRDMIIGRTPSDFDVTTSALPEEILEVFSDMKTIPTGLKHGTVTVLSGGEPIEVTTFRTDGEYLDSRHPESVSFASDVRDDLSRRDFSVNAIAYNEKRGIVDPFGGKDDIKRKLLRAVGDPDTRMKEDALRIMRALRFSAQLGFTIEENTLAALKRTRDGLAKVSRERIGVEMAKLITSPEPAEPLGIMLKTGISTYVLGDYIPNERCISELGSLAPDFFVRFACLLWDCDEVQAREILNSLKYSNAQKNGVLNLLSSRTLPYPKNDAEIRRFIISLGKHSESAAILLNVLEGAPNSLLSDIKRVSSTPFARSISELKLGGNDLLALGISGKDIGATLQRLFEAVTDNPTLNTKEELIQIIKNKDF